MAYIHAKKVGNKKYYTLRVSARDGDGKVITRDLENLGSDISKIKIEYLEKKHKNEIRKSYRDLKRFLESNHYIEKIRKEKVKSNPFFNRADLEEIEAAKLHFNSRFMKLDSLTKQEVLEFFLIKFAVSSTSIEGNTINLAEATKLLKEEILPKNKTLREVYDLQNTKKVFVEIVKNKPDLSLDMIREVHDNLLDKIDKRKGYRNHDINILGQPFKPTPARYVKSDMKMLVNWHKNQSKKIHPLALAIFFHHKFESIHPFSDGNGRTGRMVMNNLLMKRSYPPLIVPNKEREEYLNVMSEADKSIKKDLLSTEINHYKPLLDFFVRNYKKTYWNTFLVD